LVRGATDDKWEDAEDKICREKHDERKSAASPTVSLTVRRNSLNAKKKRETEMWRRAVILSTILSHLKLGQAFEEIYSYAAHALGAER